MAFMDEQIKVNGRCQVPSGSKCKKFLKKQHNKKIRRETKKIDNNHPKLYKNLFQFTIYSKRY